MDDATILQIAAQHPTYGRAMDDTIRSHGWQPTQYFQRLTHLLRTGEAHKIDPVTASRLQRVKEDRWHR